MIVELTRLDGIPFVVESSRVDGIVPNPMRGVTVFFGSGVASVDGKLDEVREKIWPKKVQFNAAFGKPATIYDRDVHEGTPMGDWPVFRDCPRCGAPHGVKPDGCCDVCKVNVTVLPSTPSFMPSGEPKWAYAIKPVTPDKSPLTLTNPSPGSSRVADHVAQAVRNVDIDYNALMVEKDVEIARLKGLLTYLPSGDLPLPTRRAPFLDSVREWQQEWQRLSAVITDRDREITELKTALAFAKGAK